MGFHSNLQSSKTMVIPGIILVALFEVLFRLHFCQRNYVDISRGEISVEKKRSADDRGVDGMLTALRGSNRL